MDLTIGRWVGMDLNILKGKAMYGAKERPQPTECVSCHESYWNVVTHGTQYWCIWCFHKVVK